MTTPMIEENDVNPQESASGDLKQRLITRVAIAGVLIVALLGGLAVLDNMNAPLPVRQVAEAPPAATPEPSPVSPKAEPAEEKPVEQAAVGEIRKPEAPAAEPEVSAPPTPSAAPLKAERPPRPLTKPAEARLAMLKPSEPLAVAKRPEPAAELARAPQTPHTGAPASRPLSHPPGSAGTFLLQVGVFSNTANAEELRAKLELNGIPAQIEARVQVGPFSSRLEAEQARDKLKQLGLEGGVLVAVKK